MVLYSDVYGDGTGRITDAGTNAYRYDEAGRLVSGTVVEAGSQVKDVFTYDAADNVTSLARNGAAPTRYAHDGPSDQAENLLMR